MPKAKKVGGWVWRSKNAKTWMITYPVPGRKRPVSESAKTTVEAEAYKLLRQRVREVEEGRVLKDADRVTFEEMANALYRDYRINNYRSLPDTRRRVTKHLLPFFTGRTMHSIRRSDIQGYIDHRLEERRVRELAAAASGRVLKQLGASNASINREVACLRRMFQIGLDEEILVKMPSFPKKLGEPPARSGFFEQREFEAVLAKLPAELRPPITFAFWTGWRIKKEILTLQWTQIDLDAGAVTLRAEQSKNKSGRPIFLPQTLQALLEGQRAERRTLYPECKWVFHRNGRRIRSYRHAWAAACREAGVPDKLVHDFRRTACRNLIRAGVPELVAMRITGHKTRSVFDRYNITAESDLKEAAAAMEKALGGGYLSSPLSTKGGTPPKKPLTH